MTKQAICITTLFLIFISVHEVSSQENKYIEIVGEIVDENFQPIAFASIVSKQTNLGTICHENGTFRIKVMKNDTLMFSALSFVQKNIAVNDFSPITNYITLKKETYNIKEVNVMGMRWNELKEQVMNKELKPEEKTILPMPGLPDPFKKRVELDLYAGNSNPISLVVAYFKKENIRKRKQKRWKKTYNKSWITREK